MPRFLTGFVSQDAIREELAKIDFATKAAELLSGGSTRDELHSFLKSQVAGLLAAYGGGDESKAAALRRFVDEALAFASERVDASSGASALFAWARRERFDQRALEAVAERARDEIGRNRKRLVALLTPMIKRNAGWQGLFIGSGTVERFLAGIQEELSEIKADKTNEFRLFVLSSIAAYAAKLLRRNRVRRRAQARPSSVEAWKRLSRTSWRARNSAAASRFSPRGSSAAWARTCREEGDGSCPSSSERRNPWPKGS